jgi:hypothetical protein
VECRRTTVNNAAYGMGLNFSSDLAPPFNGTKILSSGGGGGSGSAARYHIPSCSGADNGQDLTSHCIARRERPELVFAEPPNSTHRYSERPVFLLNGVQTKCEGSPECEAIYGTCKPGAETGHCSVTVSVTVATTLPQ